MWLTGGKPGKWTVEDRLLTLALTEYESTLCVGCGQPKDRVYTDEDLPGDQTGYVEKKRIHCEGCATQAQDLPGMGKPEAGDKDYVVWVQRQSGPRQHAHEHPRDDEGDT